MVQEHRRIGILGGTFDPIHVGHLMLAEEARVQFGLEEVVFIPAGTPWQKGEATDAEDRYMMTLLGTADNLNFSVSRIDIDRSGPTYTLDTLQELNAFYEGSAELYFITGADTIREVFTWKEPEKVLQAARFVTAARPGFDLGDPALLAERVTLMNAPVMDISSTDIRRRISEGIAFRYLVPERVAQYIFGRGLYSKENVPQESDV
ncbi:MAG TPA: nicotinate-nucleotide adenylyltransferase [Actinomycetota bacterium]|nr:nicotinate-nucleotide adenylyltransferase [Actinomycetota bacterium]